MLLLFSVRVAERLLFSVRVAERLSVWERAVHSACRSITFFNLCVCASFHLVLSLGYGI